MRKNIKSIVSPKESRVFDDTLKIRTTPLQVIIAPRCNTKINAVLDWYANYIAVFSGL